MDTIVLTQENVKTIPITIVPHGSKYERTTDKKRTTYVEFFAEKTVTTHRVKIHQVQQNCASTRMRHGQRSYLTFKLDPEDPLAKLSMVVSEHVYDKLPYEVKRGRPSKELFYRRSVRYTDNHIYVDCYPPPKVHINFEEGDELEMILDLRGVVVQHNGHSIMGVWEIVDFK